ncbi:seipin-like isoform X1 [Hippocampus zosterae]|uniref:seipin-like isoform X1 n=2 Tax=Hippocampus zosterae TaxID=109293 RepID=UPI00223C983B|nr:seipin-like isoform X1 [Hippocampus zosterae]
MTSIERYQKGSAKLAACCQKAQKTLHNDSDTPLSGTCKQRSSELGQSQSCSHFIQTLLSRRQRLETLFMGHQNTMVKMDQASHVQSGYEPFVLFGALLMRLNDAAVRVIFHVRQRVMQGITVFSMLVLLLWISAFMYGSFYYSYMPLAAYSTPVHYYYRTDCDSPNSFKCSYPVANVSLMRSNRPVLTFGQAYQITLQLDMPDSETNQEIGMFMIRTTCFSRDGGQVATSARSARQLSSASSSRFSILRYQSNLLRTMSTLLSLPMLMTGVAEQKQVLEVDLFLEYTDDPYSPSTTAVIEILSSKVQIYSSQLYIHAHFTGIRYLLFYFPVLSAVLGMSSNFIFLSVLFSYMRLLLSRPEQAQINAASRLGNGDNHNMPT